MARVRQGGRHPRNTTDEGDKSADQRLRIRAGKEPKNFEEATWKGEKYIRLKWHGAPEEYQKRHEGQRDRSTDGKKGEKGGEGKCRRATHK